MPRADPQHPQRPPRQPAAESPAASSPTSALTAALADSPRVAAQRTRLAHLGPPGPVAGPVQRTIHRYDKAESRWKVAEPGTAGRYQLPADGADGEHFNDITGVRGATLEEVRAGLVDTMMVTGSLAQLGDLDVTWPPLAKRLVGEAESAMLRNVAVDPLYLGEVYFAAAKGDAKPPLKIEPKADIDAGVVDDTWAFLKKFMQANGQMAYIERQPWFRDGDYEIHIDLNFYHDRPMGSGGLGMHKDTGGDNLFVNLVFDNEKETPATEWTQDRDPAKGVKAETLARLLPATMVDAINGTKGELGKSAYAYGEKTIQGGTLPRHGFVSWVDELIWHSTPSLAKRATFDKKTMQTELRKVWSDPEKEGAWIEAIFTLADSPGTLVAEFRKSLEDDGKVFDRAAWLRKQEEISVDADKTRWHRLWHELDTFDWPATKWSGRVGNELDKDERTGSTPSDIPTGVTGRKRSNSDPGVLKQVIDAAAVQPRRSFIRTWIRVVKAPSGKL